MPFIIIVALFITLFFTTSAQAVCAICTIAVGAGIGLTQWLGIDDSITGLWIGGLTISCIVWTINWLNKKNIHFFGRNISVIAIYYLSLVLPLYSMGLIGHLLNKFCGIDKLLFGIVIGSVVFLAGSISYNYLKKRNNNHAYFPFQKVVMPIAPLIILSFVFYFMTKC